MNIIDSNSTLLKELMQADSETIAAYSAYFNHAKRSKENTNLYSIWIYPIMYFFLICMSKLFFKRNDNLKVKTNNNCKAIYFATYYKIIRANCLYKITDVNTCITIYLPSFNFNLVKYVIKKSSEKNAYYPLFGFYDYYSFLKKYTSALIRLRKIKGANEDVRFVYKLVLQNYLYSSFVNRLINNNNDIAGKKIIVDYNRSIFLPVIQKLRSKGIRSYHLQHGVFIKPNDFYFPLYASDVLFNSEREKQYYINDGVDEKKIHIIGAPLQTITDEYNNTGVSGCYDVLVLLTSTTSEYMQKFQQLIIDFLSEKYPDQKYIFRFRPASYNDDVKKIKFRFDNYVISKGRTLSKDIYEAKKIISFSFDALFEIRRMKKQLLIMTNETDETDSLISKCTNEDRYLFDIPKFMESGEWSTLSEQDFLNNVGTTDVNIVKENFNSFLRADL